MAALRNNFRSRLVDSAPVPGPDLRRRERTDRPELVSSDMTVSLGLTASDCGTDLGNVIPKFANRLAQELRNITSTLNSYAYHSQPWQDLKQFTKTIVRLGTQVSQKEVREILEHLCEPMTTPMDVEEHALYIKSRTQLMFIVSDLSRITQLSSMMNELRESHKKRRVLDVKYLMSPRWSGTLEGRTLPQRFVCRMCGEYGSGLRLAGHTLHCAKYTKLAETLLTINSRLHRIVVRLKDTLDQLVKSSAVLDEHNSLGRRIRKTSNEGHVKEHQSTLMTLIYLVEKIQQLKPTETDVDEVYVILPQIQSLVKAVQQTAAAYPWLHDVSKVENMSALKAQLLVDMEQTTYDYQDWLVEKALVTRNNASAVLLRARAPSLQQFEIVKPLVQGAFGQIYVVRETATNEVYCMKAIDKQNLRRDQLKRIRLEKEIMAASRSPWVVTLYYSFQNRDSFFFIMEYMIGGDLYSHLKRQGRLSENDARFYVAEIVMALESVHGMNTIHRDLKPDNVLIGASGHIKLADFGLSKVEMLSREEKVYITRSPEVKAPTERSTSPTPKPNHQRVYSTVGTPTYCAPEILWGVEHSFEADFWSLGVTLFEMIAGVPPFSASNKQELFCKVSEHQVPWALLPAETSEECRAMLAQLLDLKPSKRGGPDGLRQHAWLRGIVWQHLIYAIPPFIPNPDTDSSAEYFMRNEFASNLHMSDDEIDQSFDVLNFVNVEALQKRNIELAESLPDHES